MARGSGTIVGLLRILLGLEAKDFEKEADKAKKKAKDIADAFQSVAGVSIGTTAALGALTSGVRASINAAFEQEKVMTATAAAIQATGRSGEITAEQIARLAESEMRLTSIDDEIIQSGVNMLLTFKNIGEETLPRATRAIEDMAVAMAKGETANIDLAGTAIQLGKALNDPIAGLTALQRVGVTFSKDQREAIRAMVEMGDIAGAQAMILNELESEFGGMAEAMGGTNLGKIQAAKNELDNLAATVGANLIPWLGEAASAMTRLMTWNSELGAVLQQHNLDVAMTSTTYQAYIEEMTRAIIASGQSATAFDYLTEAEFKNMQATEGLRAVNENGVAGFGALQTAAQNTTSALEGTYGVTEDLALAMKEYSAQLLFTMAAKNLDSEAAWVLADAMGLIDYKTLMAKDALDKIIETYDANADGLLSGAEAGDKFAGAVANLNTQIQLLDGREAHAYVYIHTIGGLSGSLESTFQGISKSEMEALDKGVIPEGHATGGRFTVPSGFPNDTFPLRVSSGERVDIRPSNIQDEDEEPRWAKELPGQIALAIRDAIAMSTG